MKTLYFVTGNKGKVLEAKTKFLELDIKISQKDLGYPEIQADKLEDVALFGAEYIQKKMNKPFILEDAGLFIDSLDGFPGVYSAYVFYRIGCAGSNTQFSLERYTPKRRNRSQRLSSRHRRQRNRRTK